MFKFVFRFSEYSNHKIGEALYIDPTKRMLVFESRTAERLGCLATKKLLSIIPLELLTFLLFLECFFATCYSWES